MGGARGNLPSLTALRWPAAFAVVILHAEFFLARGSATERVVHGLNASVTLFFVLSGFVLSWGYGNRSARMFYWGRIARLFPVHLLTLVAALIVNPIAFGRANTPGELLAGLLLVQAWVIHTGPAGGVNMVSWSLSVEVLFYAMLPALLCVRGWGSRWMLAVCAGWPLVCCAVSLYDPYAFSWAWLRLGEFGLGMILARRLAGGWRPARGLQAAAASGVAMWIGLTIANFGREDLPTAFFDLAILPGACWAVAYLAGRDLTGLPAMGGRVLGTWSYSLFLCHFPLVCLMGALWHPDSAAVEQVAVLSACVLSLVAAWAVFTYVERPAEKALRDLVSPRLLSAAHSGVDLAQTSAMAKDVPREQGGTPSLVIRGDA